MALLTTDNFSADIYLDKKRKRENLVLCTIDRIFITNDAYRVSSQKIAELKNSFQTHSLN